ncbi:MAG: ADP-ribosylglycohydrolase family protein [bacterium]
MRSGWNRRAMRISKFTGCLLGTAIGDSLGAAREGSLEIAETREIGPRYTDDTAMTIGVAESLIRCRGFDGEDMARRFVENFFREPWRGYGAGPPRIFTMMLRDGRRWDEMLDRELYPGGSWGNGAAMRVAPIGLFYCDEPEKLREVVHGASRITHSHELAIEGAVLQAHAVALAVRTQYPCLNREEFLAQLKGLLRSEAYLEKLDAVGRLLDRKEDRVRVIAHLGHGVEALNSVPTAVYAFLANDDFEETVVYAVSLGGDTDTIGAMAGAIAGAYYGVQKIPRAWRDKCENREYIEELARKLWEASRGGAPTGEPTP